MSTWGSRSGFVNMGEEDDMEVRLNTAPSSSGHHAAATSTPVRSASAVSTPASHGHSHSGSHGHSHGGSTPAAAAPAPAAHKGMNEADEDGPKYSEKELKGLSHAEHMELLAKWGPNKLPDDSTTWWQQLLEKFWGPMPGMIWAAVLIEGIQEEWVDFAVLFFLQLVNGFVGFIEERNAGNAIAALKNTLRPQCRVQRDGEWINTDAESLVPGDLISLKIGDVVPADGVCVNTDSIDVDQSALTGESLPVTIFNDGKIIMGSTIKRGTCYGWVTATGKNTFFGKAADLMSVAPPVSRFQKVLYQITMVLLIVSLLACGIILLDLLVVSHGEGFMQAVAVAVVILVASIPIATQVVATSTMAVGARLMAKKKAIVARLGAIEEIAGMSVLCSDKTGTLTKNILSLRQPILMTNITDAELILYSCLACHLEKGTQDAIDLCILQALNDPKKLDQYHQIKLIPFNPTDKRASALIEGPGGVQFKVCKGAAPVILRMAFNGPEIADDVNAAVQSLADRGFRALGVAISRTSNMGTAPNGGVEEAHDRWEMLGLLSMFDPPRDDTKETISKAISMGVEVKMVTGDHLAIAKETCRTLGMGANILGVDSLNASDNANLDELILNAHGFAEVMPEHKYQIVHSIQKFDKVCGMTGDGVNDAPALKRANVGIAVQGATDAAKAAADIVLIEPGLSVVIDAIVVSRKIFQRMRNYCLYRISATIQLLFFFFFSILFINPQKLAPGFPDTSFTLPVVSLVLIAVLNDVTMITIAYDKVIAGKHPQEWNLLELNIVSMVLGFIPCMSSLILLIFGLLCHESVSSDSWYAAVLGSKIDDQGHYILTRGEIQTLMYVKIAIADFLTVFSARTSWFLWERRPGKGLAISFLIATSSSTMLAWVWPFPSSEASQMESISFKTIAVVWAYNLIWFVIQDIGKVACYKSINDYQAKQSQKRSQEAQSLMMNRHVELATLQRARRGVGNVLVSGVSMVTGVSVGRAIPVNTVDDVERQVAAIEAQLNEMKAFVRRVRAAQTEMKGAPQ